MPMPIRIHPDNPKCFLFRDRPLALITATEHYGAVMNRPFDFERYLADAADKGMSLTRLFVLFRELQSAVNPYSTCKPESPDYIAPFARTGPGAAHDMHPKFDLDRPNPEFFSRLDRFLSLAAGYGVIVEVTLLSNTYGDGVWMLNPLHHENNVNGLEPAPWMDYMSLRHPQRFARQAEHVRRIVEVTRQYDNVIYEICNEPGGHAPGDDHSPTVEEVNEWEMEIARVIREADNPTAPHLIVGQEAFDYQPFTQTSTKSFRDFGVDVVNMHPLPNTVYADIAYDMGGFMSKTLKLRAVRDFCLASYDEPKPLNLDEDNVASMYKDYDGWTIHRKRAWVTLLSGGHYDYIDFSIINYCPAGTPDSRRYVRTWFKHLSEFIRGVDIVHARPLTGCLAHQPAHTMEAVFAVAGRDYCIYLADERELGDPGAGDEISGEIALDLPSGDYRIACYSPETGVWSPWLALAGGANTRVGVPAFRHDIVVRIKR